MDPPNRPHAIQGECESVARLAAFYHQSPYPPMLPTEDKGGLNSSYSPLGRYVRKPERAV